MSKKLALRVLVAITALSLAAIWGGTSLFDLQSLPSKILLLLGVGLLPVAASNYLFRLRRIGEHNSGTTNNSK
jgi:hypothetical protein